ncbi:hypothetical protein WN48_06396 [Eufriesea mexicana]|uniref:Uncharacterized protein n=1 Tax=Eufriesea mexicana TaxID=516756 RepID=A0A310SLP0_9HYME|nr:hypothetical protein WN48_06396 [Eufriesea mexicana]
MVFRRQTSEPTGSVTKTPSIAHSTSSSGILSNWYTKITTNVKKRQPFSPKSLLKKALSSCGSEFLDLPEIGLRKNREFAKYDWLSLTKGVHLVRKSVTLEKGKVPPKSNDSGGNPLLQGGDSRVPRHEKSKKKGKAFKHAEGMERKIPMPNCSTLRPGCWKTVTGLPYSTTEHGLC